MIEEHNPVVPAVIDEAKDLARADTAARVRRFRARKELEAEGLTLKKLLKLKAARAVELAATVAASDQAYRDLTPEQRSIVASEVFKSGAADRSLPGLNALRSMMHDVVALVEIGLFEEVAADLISEIHDDFIREYPFAKPMAYPRAWHADQRHDRNKKSEFAGSVYGLRNSDGKLLADYNAEDPVEYTTAQFHDAVEKWRAQCGQTRTKTSETDVVVEPERRPRMRRQLKPKRKPAEPIEPATSKSWTTPPTQPQKDHWHAVEADRAARALEKEAAETEHTKPPAF
jgi:hypothetical protein